MSGVLPDATRSIEDMRRKDARLAIGRATGIRQNPGTRLTKRTLNSAYHMLTGQAHFPRHLINSKHSSSHDQLRFDVANVCVDRGYDEGMAEYVRDDDRQRPFRGTELQDLVRALRTEPDQRPMFLRDE